MFLMRIELKWVYVHSHQPSRGNGSSYARSFYEEYGPHYSLSSGFHGGYRSEDLELGPEEYLTGISGHSEIRRG